MHMYAIFKRRSKLYLAKTHYLEEICAAIRLS